jgi:hypothetical protein
MDDQNLFSRVSSCFGRHVKLLARLQLQSLAPAPVSKRVDVRQVVKIIAESLSQHDEKHIVPTPLSGIRVRGRENWCDCGNLLLLLFIN